MLDGRSLLLLQLGLRSSLRMRWLSDGRGAKDSLQLLDDGGWWRLLRQERVDLLLEEFKLLRGDVETIVADLHEVELEVVNVREGHTADLSKETVGVVEVVVHLGSEQYRCKCEPSTVDEKMIFKI